MSRWRPSNNCLYVIPDIHGMYFGLQLILNRILPLRNSNGQKDILVFLGDYIDRKINSHMVIDLVMKTKQDFQDQVFCLLGNHELLIQDAIKPDATLENYNMWMQNGGDETLIGYLDRARSEIENPYLIQRHTIDRFIPKSHVNFFQSLLPYYETESYIFVHGGCDPYMPLEIHNPKIMAWDRSVYKNVLIMADKGIKCTWKKTLVTGHNGQLDGKPFVHDKFMMLDGSYAEKLYVWELNSRTGFSARKGKKRLVQESIS